MTQQRAPGADAIRCDTYHAILCVPDVRAAVEFFTTKLGFWRAFEEGVPARFAGVNLDQVQLFLEMGPPVPEGCALYFVVNDADELYRRHREAGIEILEAPANREYKLRDYTVRDLHGYRITFGHRL